MDIFYCGTPLWSGQPWLARTNAHPGGIAIMAQKTDILPIYIKEMYCGAANILKQDFLSIGGEAVVYHGAVNCEQEVGDVLLLGTKRQYAQLMTKLVQQPWKLKELGIRLSYVIQNVVNTQRIEPEFVAEGWQGEMIDPAENIIETMEKYPLVNKDEERWIGIDINDFADYGEYATYVLAFQSKGYKVVSVVSNSDQFKMAKYCKSQYIIQQQEERK